MEPWVRFQGVPPVPVQHSATGPRGPQPDHPDSRTFGALFRVERPQNHGGRQSRSVVLPAPRLVGLFGLPHQGRVGASVPEVGRGGTRDRWAAVHRQGLTNLCGNLPRYVSAGRRVARDPPCGRPRRCVQFGHEQETGTLINATGQPQSLLLLGGTSDIALAIAGKYLAVGGLRVVLAARPSEQRDTAAARLRGAGGELHTVDFDATDTDTHREVIDKAFATGDIDVTVVAFAVQGDDEQAWQDHAAAVELARVNYTGALSVGVVLAQHLKTQGHGAIAVLSSVAGERVRRSNFVYGSSKAGTDG